MLVKQSVQFLIQLLGGQLGLGVDYGGDVSFEVIPVDGVNVPQFPVDELSLWAGDVKAVQHQHVVRGECMDHQAGMNTEAAYVPCTAPVSYTHLTLPTT